MNYLRPTRQHPIVSKTVALILVASTIITPTAQILAQEVDQAAPIAAPDTSEVSGTLDATVGDTPSPFGDILSGLSPEIHPPMGRVLASFEA
jgi:hypothetical protein